MAKSRILVVDDEEGMLEVCEDILRRLPNTEVLVENQSQQAARRVERESIDLLITDIRMPGLDGVELLRKARRNDPNLAALIVTAFPTVETAIECMKLGAADYITKPFLPEALLATARALLERKHLGDENQLLRRQVERTYAADHLLGESQAMREVRRSISKLAEFDIDVLITGGTGTGKELVARGIHHQSNRKDRPFVPVDCGAIPEELAESEFFGHERGAFTGAQSRRLGLLEFAHEGTVFLDEIGQMPLRLQSKFLRALQERKVRRVGGMKEIPVDVRILAATSNDLEHQVQQNTFRLDLYHRIHVGRIHLPPLRERTEDIPLLTHYFLSRYAREMGRDRVVFSPEAIEILTCYSWPGNVRELQNVIKRTLAMVRHDAILPEHLPDAMVAHAGESSGQTAGGFFQLRDRKMAAFESEYLKSLLTSCRGEVTQAAQAARLPRGTFYRLLKKHELNPADFRS